MRCEKCGAAVTGDDVFCRECGTRMGELTAPGANELSPAAAGAPQKSTKPCPYCGEQILDVALKCRFCGSDLMALPVAQQARTGSNIVLNAPQPLHSMAGAAGPAPAPSIIIQNVQAQQAPAFTPGRYKNPGVALLLSFIFPGGGQFYNGHAGKGIIVLFTFWLVLPWLWSLFDAYSSAQRINRVGF